MKDRTVSWQTSQYWTKHAAHADCHFAQAVPRLNLIFSTVLTIYCEGYWRWRCCSICARPFTVICDVWHRRYLKMYCIASVANHICWTKKYRTWSSGRSIALKLNKLCKVRNFAGHFAMFIINRMKAWFKFHTSFNSALNKVNGTVLHIVVIIKRQIFSVIIFWIHSKQILTFILMNLTAIQNFWK